MMRHFALRAERLSRIFMRFKTLFEKNAMKGLSINVPTAAKPWILLMRCARYAGMSLGAVEAYRP